MKTYKVDDYTFNQIIDGQTIKKRIIEIADQINNDYQNKEPLFLITLTGGMFFGVELLKHIKLNCKCNIISAKSYGRNMQSSGKVVIEMFDTEIENEDIILIEDIVDTGLTMIEVKKKILIRSPASLSVATLINKPNCHKYKLTLEYVGFDLGEEFIVGYGLDFKGYGRNLDGIYSL